MKPADRALLAKKRGAILEGWLKSALSIYPQETANRFRDNPEKFKNPIGFAFREALEGLFDVLSSGKEPCEASKILMPLMKILAVRETSASSALGFMLALKGVLRDTLRAEREDSGLDTRPMEDFLDGALLVAFDAYVLALTSLYEIREQERKRMTYRLLERANDLYGPCAGDASDDPRAG